MLASNGNILSDAGPATDMSSLKLKLQILSKEEAISYGKNALKIGKYFVRIHPLVNAALNVYAIADYLYENKDAIQEHLRLKGDTVSFVENNIISAKEKVSSKQETRDISSIKVTSPVMPDPDREPNKFKEWIKQFEKYLKKDGSNRYDCPKQESPQWNQYENHGRTGLKTNGLRGNKKEFYRWDDLHNDYEVYDDKGRYLGSRDPISGITYRPGTGKVIERIKELIR